MPSIVAMIPVLLGSTRVPNKNLLLVDGHILCHYTIEACRDANVFTEIYLNSSDKEFKTVAESEKVKFFKRSPEFGGSACIQSTKSRNCRGERCVINDHYLYNFIKDVEADYVCQVNSTSPLLTSETIKKFTLLKDPFTIESGELTPTLKIKRNVVEQKYQLKIDAMYAEDESTNES